MCRGTGKGSLMPTWKGDPMAFTDGAIYRICSRCGPRWELPDQPHTCFTDEELQEFEDERIKTDQRVNEAFREMMPLMKGENQDV